MKVIDRLRCLADDWRVVYDLAMSSGEIILRRDQLEAWQREVQDLDQRVVEMLARKDVLTQRLKLADALLATLKGDTDSPPSGPSNHANGAGNGQRHEEEDDQEEKRGAEVALDTEMSWVEAVEKLLVSFELGASHAQLRSAVQNSILGDRLLKSDKGYYNAISRLTKKGRVLKNGGRLFTPSTKKNFDYAVERGDITSKPPPVPQQHSPMGDALLDIIAKRPGSRSQDLIKELHRDAEFSVTLTPRPTVAYNILARLRRRGQVVRRDESYFLPFKTN